MNAAAFPIRKNGDGSARPFNSRERMMKTLKLFTAYLISMLLGVFFGFCSYTFGRIGEISAQLQDGNAWLWNLESAGMLLIGVCLFFGPIFYDIFWLDSEESAS
jgi:H+/Cl- antiporter ClcA